MTIHYYNEFNPESAAMLRQMPPCEYTMVAECKQVK